jgi:fibronectin type 3 domain-containing protein
MNILRLIALATVVSAALLIAPSRASDTKHSVTLSWQATADAQSSAAVTYNIYRSADDGHTYTRIATKVSGTKYVDERVEGGKSYRYSITSVDAKGRESTRSQSIDAKVPQ